MHLCVVSMERHVSNNQSSFLGFVFFKKIFTALLKHVKYDQWLPGMPNKRTYLIWSIMSVTLYGKFWGQLMKDVLSVGRRQILKIFQGYCFEFLWFLHILLLIAYWWISKNVWTWMVIRRTSDDWWHISLGWITLKV